MKEVSVSAHDFLDCVWWSAKIRKITNEVMILVGEFAQATALYDHDNEPDLETSQRQLELLKQITEKQIEIRGLETNQWNNVKRVVDGLHLVEDNSVNYAEYIASPEWKEKAKQAQRRAGFRCQLCNNGNVQLDTHHRTYERLGHETPADLTVLCHDCHSKFHDKLP